MEEVIQVVIFFIIIISVIISKYKEVNSNRPGQVAQNDTMVFEDEEIQFQPPLQQDTPQSITCLGKDTHQTTPIKHLKHPSEVRETQTLRKPSTQPEKKSRIRFRTRKDAREAFIYSEIFNRKYE